MSNLNEVKATTATVATPKVVKKVRKMTPSNEAKAYVNGIVSELLESLDIVTMDGREDGYGMTEYTIIARLEQSDVQIKLITPARKFNGRYEVPTEEE